MKDSKQILSEIKKAVLTVDPEAELILFGSRARGDYHEESDWDVLVLSDNETNLSFKNKISDKLFYVELDNEAIIAPVIVNRKKWYKDFNGYPLFLEVRKDGIVL